MKRKFPFRFAVQLESDHRGLTAIYCWEDEVREGGTHWWIGWEHPKIALSEENLLFKSESHWLQSCIFFIFIPHSRYIWFFVYVDLDKLDISFRTLSNYNLVTILSLPSTPPPHSLPFRHYSSCQLDLIKCLNGLRADLRITKISFGDFFQD